jgi:glycosyltransferase involved in cell wall biosynthesis
VGTVKILWVKANKLLPVQSGGDIRSFNILRQLAFRHEITLFSYYGGERDVAYERELQATFQGATCLCTGRPDTAGWRRGLDYLARLPASPPYAVTRFASSGVQRRLRQWYSDRAFDVAVCDFLDAAVNFPEKLTIPTILFQHNVESEIWRRYSMTESNRGKRLLYQFESTKMLRYEQRMVGKFSRVLAVSEHDRELMSTWVDASRITVVPTGVDFKQFRPVPNAEEVLPLVVFVGAMDWAPNIDAVEYFCREIWPSVRAAVPVARFRIVGRNPDRRVHKWASDSVEVTGRVPSVVEHLCKAAVVVVPLRIGGGTRLKIYEAMAAGKAVVSTSVGAEGLDVHNGRVLILADEPGVFAEAIVTLLRDRELRSKYERAAARLAAQYDWSVVGARFAEVLEAVARGAPATVAQCAPMSGSSGCRLQGNADSVP